MLIPPSAPLDPRPRYIGFFGDSITRCMWGTHNPNMMDKDKLHIQALIQNGRIGKDIAINNGIDGATLQGNGFQHLPAVEEEIDTFTQQIPEGYRPVLNIMIGTNDLGGGDPFPGKVTLQSGSNLVIGNADTHFLNGESLGLGMGNTAFQAGDNLRLENESGPDALLPVKDVLNDHTLVLAEASPVTAIQKPYAKTVPPQRLYDQLKQYISAWKQSINQLKVLVCTIPAMRLPVITPSVRIYNQMLRQGAPVNQGGNGDLGADGLVDVAALPMFSEQPPADSPYYVDSVHPSSKGIVEYAKTIGQALLNI